MSDQKKFIALFGMISLSCVISAASLMASINNGAHIIFGDDVKNGTLEISESNQQVKPKS